MTSTYFNSQLAPTLFPTCQSNMLSTCVHVHIVSTLCTINLLNACIICHLTLVVFLNYLTLHRSPNATSTSWSRGSLTHGNVFLRASLTKPLTSGKHSCVHV